MPAFLVIPLCLAGVVVLAGLWLWVDWRRSKYYNNGDLPGTPFHRRRVIIGWVLFVIRDILLFWLPYE